MNTPTVPSADGVRMDVSREKLEVQTPPRVVMREEIPQAVVDAEKARDDAYHAVHSWRGVVLKPFSRGREDLWKRLCAADLPLPPNFSIRENLPAWTGHATKLLYLCSHDPEDFAHLRADTPAFLEAVDEWGDETISREDEIEAVILALKIHNDAHVTMAIPRPSDRKTDSGN